LALDEVAPASNSAQSVIGMAERSNARLLAAAGVFLALVAKFENAADFRSAIRAGFAGSSPAERTHFVAPNEAGFYSLRGRDQ
jgi:hypothetical protein